MCFAPQPRAIFLWSERPKWLRHHQFFSVFTCKCASRGKVFFAPLYGLVLPSPGKGFFRHASIGPPPTRFMLVCFVHLLWVLFRPSTRPPYVWGSFTFFCASLGVWVPFETSFRPGSDLPRDHAMLGGHCGVLHRVLFGPLLGPVLTVHATTPCLGFITVCTRFFLDLFRALFWPSTRPPPCLGSLGFFWVSFGYCSDLPMVGGSLGPCSELPCDHPMLHSVFVCFCFLPALVSNLYLWPDIGSSLQG